MKLKVGVIFGGNSVEHEVSIISAIQAIDNMDKDKYEIIPIYIAKDMTWYSGPVLLKIENYKDIDNLLKKCKKVCLCKKKEEFCLIDVDSRIKNIVNKIDIAFPIVHGKNVEDGSLAGFFETIGIPYVGSGVIGSAIGQDKVILKHVLLANSIPVVDYIWFYDYEYLNNKNEIIKKVKELEYPVIVKPACLGSSVGIKFVRNEKDICEAIEDAITYDKKILVEKAVSNLVEVNCSVFGDYQECDISVTEQVKTSNSILTYEDKYIGNGKKCGKVCKGIVNTDRIIPAMLDKDILNNINMLSKEVFRVLNLSGVCRIDFLIDMNNKKVYVNESNIIPGSLAFYLWESKGIKYSELLDRMIELGIKNYKEKLKKINSFESNILSNYNGANGTKK